MDLQELNQAVDACTRGARAGLGHAGKEPFADLPGLAVFESRAPTEIQTTLYTPAVCLTLQGSKEYGVGAGKQRSRPGHLLIVSHDLPVTSRIVEASAARPYRALVLLLDIALLRSLVDEVGAEALVERQSKAMQVEAAERAFIDAFARYFALTGSPLEAQVMAPLIRKELHFRLLTANHGGMLRRLLNHDSHASRIGRAIALIRQNFREPIAVAALAKAAGMSASSFHAHFRAITETTPLQYQKELRLIEARRLLIEQGLTVSAAAFGVGYESPTQFSREYSRKFGAPPRHHLQAAEARRA